MRRKKYHQNLKLNYFISFTLRFNALLKLSDSCSYTTRKLINTGPRYVGRYNFLHYMYTVVTVTGTGRSSGCTSTRQQSNRLQSTRQLIKQSTCLFRLQLTDAKANNYADADAVANTHARACIRTRRRRRTRTFTYTSTFSNTCTCTRTFTHTFTRTVPRTRQVRIGQVMLGFVRFDNVDVIYQLTK